MSSSMDIVECKKKIEYLESVLKEINNDNLNSAKICTKLRRTYDCGVKLSPKDYELQLAYFEFCKQYNITNVASTVASNLVNNFPEKPEVYKLLSNWHKRCGDLVAAQTAISTGLSKHIRSELLYTEAIELELLHASRINSKKLDRINAHLEAIYLHVKNVNFLIKILKLLEAYSFTMPIQHKIIKKMFENYFGEDIIWDTLAQREKNGLYFDGSNSSLTNIQRCILMYQKGLTTVKPESKSNLWISYLNFLVDTLRKNRYSDSTIVNAFKSAIREASYDKVDLTEEYYLAWAEVEKNNSTALQDVFQKGFEAMPTSLRLWKLRLLFAMINDNEVNTVLREANKALGDNAGPIWLQVIRYHTINSSDGVEDIFKEGIQQTKSVSDLLKPKYLAWIVQDQGIEKARELYNEIAPREPYCKQLHEVMIEIESLEIVTDLHAWDQALTMYCNQFGNVDSDPWVHYLKFLKFILKSESEMPKLYRKGLDTLPELMKANLINEYLKL